MAKHRNKREEREFEDDEFSAMLTDIEFDLDDEEFEKQFVSKKSRSNSKRARDARRRIEEYREDRDLKLRISEYWDDWDE